MKRMFTSRSLLLAAAMLILPLSACSTQSNVAAEYQEQSLSGGTLVVAPLQGKVQVEEHLSTGTLGNDPVSTYARFLRRELPDVIAGRTSFDHVVYAEEYAGETNFTSNVVEYKNSMGGKRKAYLDVPVSGTAAQFEDVEADYVLFLKDVHLLYAETPSVNGPSFPNLRQSMKFILWDNQRSRYVMNGGGVSRQIAGPVVSEKTMRKATESLADNIMEGSPFQK